MLILKFDAPTKFICGNRRTGDAGTPPFAAGGSVQTMALSPSNFIFFVICTPFKTSEATSFSCSLTCLYDLTPLVVLCPIRSIISCSSTPALNKHVAAVWQSLSGRSRGHLSYKAYKTISRIVCFLSGLLL